jgi:cell division protein FtsI/penicillin-binding protein 2
MGNIKSAGHEKMKGKYKNIFERKIFFITSFIIFIFSILAVRLYQLQLLSRNELKVKAERQSKNKKLLKPRRGGIKDFKNNILAISASSQSLYVRPPDFYASEEDFHQLASLLGVSSVRLSTKVYSNYRKFLWLKRQLNDEIVAKLKDLDIKGIGFVEENKRFYPRDILACHVLGFTDIDGVGLEGIEAYYEELLEGSSGWRLQRKDAARRPIASLLRKEISVKDGYNLILYIDMNIQGIVEEELDKLLTKYQPQKAMVIVSDPKTGGIVAMANRPGFNPEKFYKTKASDRRNYAVSNVYEHGSTFKPITAAMALEEGLFKINDRIFCENGSFVIKRHAISDTHAYGWLTFQEVIEKSSNIGLSKIALRVGKDKFYHYLKDFGFFNTTGIDLLGEARPLIQRRSTWSDLTLATMSFGHGISVTPIQLIQAYNCLANGGVMTKPRLLWGIETPYGERVSFNKFNKTTRVVSEKTAEEVTRILTAVVEDGTGRKAKIKNCKIAGKTGTAAKLSPAGGYSSNKFISSFIGYFPADNPRFVVLVMVDEPKGKYYGGEVAAPVFNNITRKILKYSGLISKHEYNIALKEVSSEDYPVSDKVEVIFDKGFFPLTSLKQETSIMPSLKGKSIREAIKILMPYKLNISMKGSGLIIEQYPEEGKSVSLGEKCELVCKPR